MATSKAHKRAASASRLSATLEQELNIHLLERCRELVQEYSDLSRQAPELFPFTERDLTAWYAETRYKLLGAGRCSLCGAQVRHAVPVMAELDEHTVVLHPCLCAHCLAAQESAARRVVVCMHRPMVNVSAPPAWDTLAA